LRDVRLSAVRSRSGTFWILRINALRLSAGGMEESSTVSLVPLTAVFVKR
jgi:hypothetical protein